MYVLVKKVILLTANKFLRSASLNLKGMFDMCSLFGPSSVGDASPSCSILVYPNLSEAESPEVVFFFIRIVNYFYARAELRRLFCTFVDYSKAFDSINRATLWKKLFSYGITGKVIDVIMNMYKSIKSCVMDSGIVRFFCITCRSETRRELITTSVCFVPQCFGYIFH